MTETNDNEVTPTDGKDEEILQKFIQMIIDEGIDISVGFVPDDNGFFTKQFLRISRGEYATLSDPVPMKVPVMPAPFPEAGITVN